MKKPIALLLAAACLLPVPACAQPVEPDLTGYAAGPAEIPKEILGELDPDTLENLVEEPGRGARAGVDFFLPRPYTVATIRRGRIG